MNKLLNIIGRAWQDSAGYLKVKTLPRCVLWHSLFEWDDTLLGAGNCHHNCMIIPHSSPVITSSLSNNFFYFLCWARLPDLRTRDLRHHSKMLSDLETDSTLIVGFNTLPRHETCQPVTTLMRSAVSRNYNRSPWDQANPGETWAHILVDCYTTITTNTFSACVIAAS